MKEHMAVDHGWKVHPDPMRFVREARERGVEPSVKVIPLRSGRTLRIWHISDTDMKVAEEGP